MFVSRYMPCQFCGESVDRTAPQPHECAPERRAAFQMWALRREIEDFERLFQAYLDTPHGQFDLWLSVRQVRSAREARRDREG